MEFKIKGQELLTKIEELIKEGNARRIIIKDDKGRTYIEIPVTVGVIGNVVCPDSSSCWRTGRSCCQFYDRGD